MPSSSFAAIMFADVSGSSQLFKQAGDIRARSILAKILDMMALATIRHSGRVIKTIGDECMSAFPNAEAALQASVEMHEAIETHNYGAALTIRIGFHYGAVIEEQGDIFGEAVNDAADLVKVAKGGQTITCHRTVSLLLADLQEQFSQFDEIRIKGGRSTEIIYLHNRGHRNEQSDSTMFMPTFNLSELNTGLAKEQILLLYNGEKITVKKEDMPLTIGRSEAADLTITFIMTSREHCILDYRHGKFVLIDRSTNGTYVIPSGRSPVYLRREETPLSNSGKISFSQSFYTEGAHILHYSCE
ncbi:MAG: adenylate/guanylate cyclase domain-containing protein [Thiolinea sp.]